MGELKKNAALLRIQSNHYLRTPSSYGHLSITNILFLLFFFKKNNLYDILLVYVKFNADNGNCANFGRRE